MILKVPIFVNYTLENDIRARAWAERGDQIRNYQITKQRGWEISGHWERKEQKSEGTTYNTMHLALATINVRMLQTNSIRKSNWSSNYFVPSTNFPCSAKY